MGKARAEQLTAYERLRQQVLEWLNFMENRVGQLEPVAIEPETIRKQAEEIKVKRILFQLFLSRKFSWVSFYNGTNNACLQPLLKEYREYGIQIDKVNDLGNAYDSLLRGERPDSPSRRRSSAFSPNKRPSVSATPSESSNIIIHDTIHII